MVDFLTGYVMGGAAAARAGTMSRAAASAAASSTAGSLADLDARIDRLLLVVEALWSMLERHGHTVDELADRIRELDARDGVADGRRTPRPSHCDSCDSMVQPGLRSCPYCGAALGETSTFDQV